MFLPQRASNVLVYISQMHGGANIPLTGDLCNVTMITHTFHLLTCPDAMVRNITESALQDAIKKRITRTPSNQYVLTYLSGLLEGEFGRDGRLCFTLDSCLQCYTTGLDYMSGCHWTWCNELQELGDLVPQVKNTDHTIITPRARPMLERTLKDATCCQYVENLKRKLDQGKAFEVMCKCDVSNHFLPEGSFTQFADWRFIHRAQLNCVPLNRAVCHGNQD
nr:uncharacterized protein LOC125640695 [Caretta caretta]